MDAMREIGAVVLQDLRSGDARNSAELARGKVVEHRDDLQIDGEARTFTAIVLPRTLVDEAPGARA